MSRIKHEEMVPLADMVWASFKRDRAEIEAENHTFTEDYLNDFKVMIEEVRDLEQSDSLLVTQMAVTGQLYLAADGMNKELKLFQLVLKSSGLDSDLVSVLLKNIKKRNIEGALMNIKSIGQVVNANLALFTSKGMKADFPTLLADKFSVMTDLSNQQTQLMKDRRTLVDGNEGTYAALSVYLSKVSGIGKAVYAGTVKADEYTISKMLMKLHTSKGTPPPPTA